MKIIINEHFVNVFDRETKIAYLDEVWKILENSYQKIGGIQGTSKNELLEDNLFWKLVSRNNKITAVMIYKTSSGGRKAIAGGSDGTTQGKNDLYKIIEEDSKLSDRYTWGEVSGAMEHLYIEKYDAIPICVDYAEKILNKLGKIIERIPGDDYHYTRIISGKPYVKMMFGHLPEELRGLT